MADLFANKFRIKTTRLQSWNYADEAAYFITICTKNKENYFGEIIFPNAVETRCIASLQPTEIGIIAQDEWLKTPELRPDINIELGEFVVMPNHVHGIIMIGANDYNAPRTEYKNTFTAQSKNLASIIRGYKSAVTTYARKNNLEFDWQSRFHEHIIRTVEDYRKISEYIMSNPAKWHLDKFFNQ
jgi:REP element-mobilizing transposase RayT